MKQKHIDASREARLWIKEIIVPIVVGGMMIPSVRESAMKKYEDAKNKVIDITNKIKK